MTPSHWIDIAAAAACPPGTCAEYLVQGQVVALFNVQGEFFALDGVCPHQGGPLGSGHLDGCLVTCPWHGWQFDVTNGANEVTRHLRQPTFPTRIVDGRVQIAMPPDTQGNPEIQGTAADSDFAKRSAEPNEPRAQNDDMNH